MILGGHPFARSFRLVAWALMASCSLSALEPYIASAQPAPQPAPQPIPMPPQPPPPPGVLLLIETDTAETTDFVVTVQITGAESLTRKFHRESTAATPAWFPCDPHKVQSVKIDEVRTISVQTF